MGKIMNHLTDIFAKIQEQILFWNTTIPKESWGQFVLEEYYKLTSNHIHLVKVFGQKLAQVILTSEIEQTQLLEQLAKHDQDKLNGTADHIANYATNTLTFYKNKETYQPTPESVAAFEEEFWPKHYCCNLHHPEHWAIDPNLDLGVTTKPKLKKTLLGQIDATSMPIVSIIEMVADWMAVGLVNGNRAKTWWNDQRDVKWLFSSEQVKVIEKCIEVETTLYSADPLNPITHEGVLKEALHEDDARPVLAQEESVEKNVSANETLDGIILTNYKCCECGYTGEVVVNKGKVVCPKCKTTNDVWDHDSKPPMSHTEQVQHNLIEQKAKCLYKPIGQNSWQHIQQVLRQATMFTRKFYNRELSLIEYATVLFHDCSVKSKPDKAKHGYYSAESAKSILKETGFFTVSDLTKIYTAIVEHDADTNPKMKFSSELSDLLASADFNPPDYLWIMNKSYSWGIAHGLTHEERIANVSTHIPKVYGSHGTAVFPKLYSKYYNSYIKKMQIFFDKLTPEIAEHSILEYRKKHKLSITDIRLPDVSVSVESTLVTLSMEAIFDDNTHKKNEKRKKIIALIVKTMDIADPSKVNGKFWEGFLSGLSNKDFDNFMSALRDKKVQMYITAPNLKLNLSNDNLLAAADSLGIQIFHRIRRKDSITGKTYITPNAYPVLQLPIRRMQQFLDEKMSVPDNDRSIDGLTGQVTSDSRACSITNPEIHILAARGLDHALSEFTQVRAGNIHAYAEFKRQLEEKGSVDLASLDKTSRTRTAVMAKVLLQCMMYDTNL